MRRAAKARAWWLAAALLGSVACAAEEGGAPMAWERRALRQACPEGYLAIVSLAGEDTVAREAALVCEAEGLELRLEADRWEALKDGESVARGQLGGRAPAGFCVKRTPKTLLVGGNGRWFYGCEVDPPTGPAAVRVGLSGGLALKSFRIVPREPVRFADDFPDPEPKTEVWTPVCGQWALSSLSFPQQSANPAELAAVFEPLDDPASLGRTREVAVGIGVQLPPEGAAIVVGLAPESPAERAGIRMGDLIVKVNGTAVRYAAEATLHLRGQTGEKVKVTFRQEGQEREVELARELVEWGRTRRQVSLRPSKRGPEALITTGYDFWTDYRFSVHVRTEGAGAVGLVFAYLGPQDYHVFRWLGAEKTDEGFGRWQLERMRGGKKLIVADRDGGFLPRDFYSLSVRIEGDELGQVKVECAVDGRTVLEDYDDAIVPGRIGLWAEEPGDVCFDDIVVGEPERKLVRGSRSDAQRGDRLMRAWADPAYSWAEAGGELWNKEDFPGDVTLAAPMPRMLVVSAAKRSAETGYAFEMAAEGKEGLLKRAGKIVAQQAMPPGEHKQIALERRGASVRVLLDGAPWLACQDPSPLTGSNVGAAGVFATSVQVDSPDAVEDYFNGSPSSWHVMHGTWEVMNRWVCDPRWSFFGGRGDHALAVWNKRRLEGDCALSAHVGVMMMAMGGYRNMRDVGLTLCGDGRNLSSGYVAIIGAANNTLTALYRNGKVVATTNHYAALLPRIQMSGNELYTQHRGWVHCKLVKEGKTVRLFIWDNQVLNYYDPEPIEGGYAAIWTVENGLLIGKARVAATRLGELDPFPFLRAYRSFTDPCLTNEDTGAKVDIVQDGSAYQVTNTVGGGTFAVALRPRVFSAVDRPRLAFDVKVDPEAKVDFYFGCHGTLYRVKLTGPDNAPTPTLGSFEGVQADGEWHRVSFDLQRVLAPMFPKDDPLVVWQPVLGNFANHQYLLAGFGGNPAGASYSLRDISLPFEGKTAHLSRKLPAF